MRRESSISIFVWLLLAVGVVGLTWLQTRFDGTPDPRDHPAVGLPLPELLVTGLTGRGSESPPASLALSDVRGKVVLLNIWGPWCGYCLRELPDLAEIEAKYRSHPDFVMLPISYPRGESTTDELRAATRASLEARQVGFATYKDVDGLTMFGLEAVMNEGGLGFPTSLVIGPSGEIHAVCAGYQRGALLQLGDVIGELLEEQSPSRESDATVADKNGADKNGTDTNGANTTGLELTVPDNRAEAAAKRNPL